MKVKLSEFPIQPQTMECCRECIGKKKDCIPNPMCCIDFVIANDAFISRKKEEANNKLEPGITTINCNLVQEKRCDE